MRDSNGEADCDADADCEGNERGAGTLKRAPGQPYNLIIAQL